MGTDRRLDLWKEIAAYLIRDVTTVQRCEKRERMPVHRHQHDKRGSVYALKDELDAWIASRRLLGGQSESKPEIEAPSILQGQRTSRRKWRAVLWFALGAFVGLYLTAAAWLAVRHRATKGVPPAFGRLRCCPFGTCQGIQQRSTWRTESLTPLSNAFRVSTNSA